MEHLLDLSHPLRDGSPAYPGLPSLRVSAIIDHESSRPRYDGKAEFHLGGVEMSVNTGTYLDVPFHRYRDGADLAAVGLERLASLPGVVIDAPPEPRAVTPAVSPEQLRGRAVLIRTGWSRRWGTEGYYASTGPFLSAEALDLLLEGGVALVGVDFANVDDTADHARPAHTRLLGAGIPIVEHLTGLEALPSTGFRFTAVPLPIEGLGSFPVRAFAEIGR